jgi:hypothetical protein
MTAISPVACTIPPAEELIVEETVNFFEEETNRLSPKHHHTCMQIVRNMTSSLLVNLRLMRSQGASSAALKKAAEVGLKKMHESVPYFCTDTTHRASSLIEREIAELNLPPAHEPTHSSDHKNKTSLFETLFQGTTEEALQHHYGTTISKTGGLLTRFYLAKPEENSQNPTTDRLSEAMGGLATDSAVTLLAEGIDAPALPLIFAIHAAGAAGKFLEKGYDYNKYPSNPIAERYCTEWCVDPQELERLGRAVGRTMQVPLQIFYKVEHAAGREVALALEDLGITDKNITQTAQFLKRVITKAGELPEGDDPSAPPCPILLSSSDRTENGTLRTSVTFDKVRR